jgi:hypothetical protein
MRRRAKKIWVEVAPATYHNFSYRTVSTWSAGLASVRGYGIDSCQLLLPDKFALADRITQGGEAGTKHRRGLRARARGVDKQTARRQCSLCDIHFRHQRYPQTFSLSLVWTRSLPRIRSVDMQDKIAKPPPVKRHYCDNKERDCEVPHLLSFDRSRMAARGRRRTPVCHDRYAQRFSLARLFEFALLHPYRTFN